jgi:hypothetical protein
MVIVVMSPNTRAAGDLARRLSATLGWPCVDATKTPAVVREAIAHAHDRREHEVIWTSLLTRAERQHAVAGISQVRLVQAADSGTDAGWSDAEAILTVDVQSDPDGVIAVIRDAFGV